MSYCGKCGTKLDKNTKYCPSCGSEIIQSKPKQTENLNQSIPGAPVSSTSKIPVVDTPKEPIDETEVSSEPEVGDEELKKKGLRDLIIGIVILLGVAAVFFLYVRPKYFMEKVVPDLTMETASGYWVSSKVDKFAVEDLDMSLYIDEEMVVVAEDGEETINRYTVEDHLVDEEMGELEISLLDVEGTESTLHLQMSDESTEDSIVMVIESPTTDSTEFVSVAESTYFEAGGSNLKELSEVEVEEEAEEVSEFTISDVLGYYVGRDEENKIDFILKIAEDYTTRVSLHPIDGSVVAFGASHIDNLTIEGHLIEMDVRMVDHHSSRHSEIHEIESTFDFDMDANPIQFYLNGSESPTVYMELEDIEAEIEGAELDDVEGRLQSLYEDTLLDIIEIEENTGGTTS